MNTDDKPSPQQAPTKPPTQTPPPPPQKIETYSYEPKPIQPEPPKK